MSASCASAKSASKKVSPSKKTTKTADSSLSPFEISSDSEAEMTPKVSASAKKTLTQMTPTKSNILKQKRARVESSGEEDELSMESSTQAVATRKRRKTQLPSPGTREYAQLQPVTFSKSLANMQVTNTDNESDDFTSPVKVKGESSSKKLSFGEAIVPLDFSSKPKASKDSSKNKKLTSDEESGGDAASDSASIHSIMQRSKGKGKATAKVEGSPSERSKGKTKATSTLESKKQSEEFVYMEDLYKQRYSPNVDEDPNLAVMQEHIQDDKLKKTYQDLPWIKPAAFNSWGTSFTDEGPIWFSAWEPVLVPYDEKYLIRWITFQKAGKFVNLSRVDPSCLGRGGEPTSYLTHPGVTHGYLVATSLIYVHECALRSPKPVGESFQKKLGGILHSQEMERLIGCLGMVFDFESIDANMFGSTLYFVTKRGDSQSRNNSPVKGHKGQISFFRSAPSPAVRSVSRTNGSFRPVLNCYDDVPIYDGRKHQLDPNKHLPHISKLPLWKNGKEDAPKRCAAVVGYTVNTYTSHQVRQLSLNVQWLIVLGTIDA